MNLWIVMEYPREKALKSILKMNVPCALLNSWGGDGAKFVAHNN
jgi:hypothetical protein